MKIITKIVHRLKKLIYPLVPIGYFEYRDKKRENSFNYFWGSYKKYKLNEDELIKGGIPERNYKQVIAVCGFGYSGSGAVVDLFAECDNCLCVGDSDENTFDKVDVTIGYETDFLRLAGGLFEIERYLGCGNFFLNDALLNRFVKCVESFPPFKQDERIRVCFFEFFDKITELKIADLKWNAYNSFLYPYKKRSNIFFLKKLSLSEYRSLANTFLIKLFNILNYSNSAFLVFDQLLSDGELDSARNQCYIKNVKSIVVYRDPRDLYAFAHKTDMAWIAHDNVDSFITWYNIMVRNLNFEDPNTLIVQFEKLVTDYDNEISRIFEFVGFDENLHRTNKMKTRFKPDFSIRNVGIWKQCHLPVSDFDKIKQTLSQYCF